MQRYFNVVAILCATVAAALILPAAASAGCPGCEEYTLDIPENDGGGGDSTPAPAPAPAPAAPAVPAPTTPTTTVPEATTPVAPVVVEPEKKKPKPVDTDPDPVPDDAAVKPVDLTGVPAIAASQSRPLAPTEDDAGGLLPLALAMGAVALVAALVGVRRRGPGGDEPSG